MDPCQRRPNTTTTPLGPPYATDSACARESCTDAAAESCGSGSPPPCSQDPQGTPFSHAVMSDAVMSEKESAAVDVTEPSDAVASAGPQIAPAIVPPSAEDLAMAESRK